MNFKSFLSALFFLITGLIAAQSDNLNQYDSNGKKEGKWIVYLDQNWKKTDDSSKATYYRFTYFDHGTNIQPMGMAGGKGFKLEPGRSGNDKLVLLDGEYKWYDAEGKLSSVHVFKNGDYVSCKEYFKSGELSQYFDYTKKCEGQPNSWTVTVYDKKGNVKLVSQTCKDKNGKWPVMRG